MYSVYTHTEKSLNHVRGNMTRNERNQLIRELALKRKSDGKGPSNLSIVTYCGNSFHSSF